MTQLARYRLSERERYEPPACPDCGRRVTQLWVDVTCTGDPQPMATPGRWVCRTPGCQYGPPERIPPSGGVAA